MLGARFVNSDIAGGPELKSPSLPDHDWIFPYEIMGAGPITRGVSFAGIFLRCKKSIDGNFDVVSGPGI